MFRKKPFGQQSTEQTPESIEAGYTRMRLPNHDDLEQFAVVTQLMGSNQIKAIGEDGVERQFRIPGKLLKKVWIRENDIIVVQAWDFQPTKGNVVWRYLGNQVEWLRRSGKLAKLERL
ncbi:MAG: translation initiation factor eIF-1A [archaeon]